MIDARYTLRSVIAVAICGAVNLSATLALSSCAAAHHAQAVRWEYGRISEIAGSDWLASHVSNVCRPTQPEGKSAGYARVAMDKFHGEVAWRIVPLTVDAHLNVGDRVRFDSANCRLVLETVAGAQPDPHKPS